jgi:hypothetical protein
VGGVGDEAALQVGARDRGSLAAYGIHRPQRLVKEPIRARSSFMAGTARTKVVPSSVVVEVSGAGGEPTYTVNGPDRAVTCSAATR